MRGANQGQKSCKGPVRGGAASFEQSGDTEDKCASAHRGHILRCGSLPADKLYRVAITYCFDDTGATAGDADQIEWRAIRKCMRRHQTKTAITRYRSC